MPGSFYKSAINAIHLVRNAYDELISPDKAKTKVMAMLLAALDEASEDNDDKLLEACKKALIKLEDKYPDPIMGDQANSSKMKLPLIQLLDAWRTNEIETSSERKQDGERIGRQEAISLVGSYSQSLVSDLESGKALPAIVDGIGVLTINSWPTIQKHSGMMDEPPPSTPREDALYIMGATAGVITTGMYFAQQMSRLKLR